MRRILLVSILTQTSRTSAKNGFLRLAAWRAGSFPTRSERMWPPSATGRSSLQASGVDRLKRVTMRQPAACILYNAMPSR